MAPPPPLGSSDSGAASAGAGTALDYNGRFRPRRQARGSPRNGGLAGRLEDEVERDIGLVSEKTGMPTWAVVTLMIVILGWRSHLN